MAIFSYPDSHNHISENGDVLETFFMMIHNLMKKNSPILLDNENVNFDTMFMCGKLKIALPFCGYQPCSGFIIYVCKFVLIIDIVLLLTFLPHKTINFILSPYQEPSTRKLTAEATTTPGEILPRRMRMRIG